MRKLLDAAALALVITLTAGTALAADVFLPGRLVIVKPGRLLQFIARTRAPHLGLPFPLPSANPTTTGATLRVYDTGGVAGRPRTGRVSATRPARAASATRAPGRRPTRAPPSSSRRARYARCVVAPV
jgi:hypothetical protein